MKIDRIEIRQISLPYIVPFKTSGWEEKENNSIIVKVYSEGMLGYGESAVSRFPFYVDETSESVWNIQKELLIPSILHKELSSPADVTNFFEVITGSFFAKAGIESAIYDLFAKQEKKSLSSYLSGTRKKIPVGVSIGIPSSKKELLKIVDKYLSLGYNRIKIKISPEWDVEPIKAIRYKHKDILLQVDANCAYKLSDAQRFAELDKYYLLLIEQPFGKDDYADHAKLQEQIFTPICLDEGISSIKDTERAIKEGSCKIINIKMGRVGGITIAKDIHEYCLKSKIPVWCGGMLETGIGRAINASLASLPGFTLPGDISTNDRYFKKDIVENPFTLNNDSTIDVPVLPGHGAVVNEKYLEEVTLRKEVFS